MIPDEVIKRIQDLFRPSPVLLVGSGFSCGYGLPGMWEVAQHLIGALNSSSMSRDAFSLWEAHRAEINEDFEKGLNQIPSGAPAREELVAEIRKLISRLIVNRTADAECRIRSVKNPQTEAPARLLKRIYAGIPQNTECAPIITTNYDTLLELFCDFAKLPLDTGFEGHRHRFFREGTIYRTLYRRESVQVKNIMQFEYRHFTNIRLLKPHGSVAWHSTDYGPVEILNHADAGSRAIVIPGPSKYEDALVMTLFDSVRTEMNACIRNASGLMCLGFGFNDAHLQGAIRDRLRYRMPMLILTKKLTANIEALLADHPHIISISEHPDGSSCHADGSIYVSNEPIWTLDCFLKTFLE
ncbi:SIR2 family protein [Pararoseomonas sp. SCSIO 73927]|uniref:SIR2 family protein n=1 Tax=Pararoseomonas sp. SCSIO 73927 TaxID=3114537 RepID=UPI0030CAE2F0